MLGNPWIFGICVFIAGCCGMCAETTRSENVRTEGMAADIRIDARGAGKTEISATLRVGGPLSNLYPQMSGGDRLEATNGVDTIPLAFGTHVISRPSYSGSFAGDSSGQTIAIRFLRTGNTSATGTRVVMPPSFTITSPPAGATYSPTKSTLVVTWSKAGPMPVTWSVDGPCVAVERGDLPSDPGRIEVALRTAAPGDGGAPSKCNVEVRLERVARGVLDPAFGEGGAIVASQERRHVVAYTP